MTRPYDAAALTEPSVPKKIEANEAPKAASKMAPATTHKQEVFSSQLAPYLEAKNGGAKRAKHVF